MKKVSSEISDMFYQRALAFEQPFKARDLLLISDIAIRRELRDIWLKEMTEKGELRRVKRGYDVFYEWVNE